MEVEKLVWLEKFEKFLANIYTTWNGILIVIGDINNDLLSHQNESKNRYKNILHIFSLQQRVTKSTRKGKTLIDHISSNISTKSRHCNVISTDKISDHHEPYAIFNTKKERFLKRYKYVQDKKNLDMNKYIMEFKQLSTSSVCAFDFNSQKISDSMYIWRCSFNDPPAPRLKDPEISKAKSVLDNLQTKSRDLNHSDLTVRQNYQTARNRYKKTIRSKIASFLRSC